MSDRIHANTYQGGAFAESSSHSLHIGNERWFTCLGARRQPQADRTFNHASVLLHLPSALLLCVFLSPTLYRIHLDFKSLLHFSVREGMRSFFVCLDLSVTLRKITVICAMWLKSLLLVKNKQANKPLMTLKARQSWGVAWEATDMCNL